MDLPARPPSFRGMGLSHEFGRRCEDLAAAYLEDRGWTVIARNYRFGHREIDLVARRGGVVAFIEVKGRRGSGFGHPLEAITARKRREIERVARQWVARHGRPGDAFRFDAVSVTEPDGAACVRHVEDAWRIESGAQRR